MRWRQAAQGDRAPSCASCAHFDNAPGSIEAAFGNLGAMSSGWASVRDQDGICSTRGIYLSARASCAAHVTRQATAPAPRAPAVASALPDLGLELTPLAF